MKKLTKVLSLMLVAALVLGTFAVPASAATKKKTVKELKFQTETKKAEKKDAVVKKGTTKLTVKGGQGYIKFVAPKSKTYTFTFSDLKSKNGYYCHISVQQKNVRDGKYLEFLDVKTKGGKTHFLQFGVNGRSTSYGDVVNRYLTKRSAKVKLKKGKAIYFHLSNAPQKTTLKLKIK